MTGSATVHARLVPRLRGPVLTGVGVAAATALLAVAGPERRTFYLCPLHALTGLWCPGCGALRATEALAHLDVAAAWDWNPLWVVVAPLLVGWWALWLVATWQQRPTPPVPRRVWMTLVLVVVVFGVLRNLPVLAPWLAPGVS